MGQIFGSIFTGILIPLVWHLISFFGSLYHRAFVVFTEFVTGVHDWPTYRTSSFKFIGAFSAFIGFNALLLDLAGLVAVVATPAGIQGRGAAISGEIALSAVAVAALCASRLFMRRMP